MRKYRFFFHYNKPATEQQGRVIWTLHWRRRCYTADKIVCHVPTTTKINARQPRGVVQGWCTEVEFHEGVVTVR